MKYNFLTEPPKPKTAIVITPTIGSPKLQDAVDSVQQQTYEHVQHLVVIDGSQYTDAVKSNIIKSSLRTTYTVAPENTGANGFNGQRIYAAYPHLINSDYVFFLDEDNWYAPDHIETLVKVLEEGNDFAFSLRQIYDKDKNYLCDDNCESLGKWPIYFTHDKEEHFLIDTSSYAFTKNFIQMTCHLWHSGPWGEDRRYLAMVKDKAKFDTNGMHTMCYRLDGNSNSVKLGFFEQGNEEQHKRFNGKFPWMKVKG